MTRRNPTVPPSGDLLYGAKAVAEFLGVKKSIAVHLMRAKLIPTFPLGDIHCARRSSITRHFETMEARNGERS
ncbi:UNVERIFIED_CONTAM: DNA-binding protein [Methylobacteriaceae bacterium AG10]|nr:DNA-binding protein [Methylobacteriaceae bacterium AG10]